MDLPEVSEEIVKAFADVDVSHVSDALDRCGIAGQCFGIMPLDRRFRLVGLAFTVRYLPVGTERGTVGDYIDDLAAGQVVVLDNAGRTDATVWGDLLTATAHRRGIAGTVIDGVCRDSDRSLELGYPIFSRGSWMRTGKDRVMVDRYQVPVHVGGVLVRPGDVLVGGGDGLVAVPAERAAEVLGVAREIGEREARIRAAVQGGERLDEARRAVGYYELQRRG